MVTQPGPKNPNWGGGKAITSHGYLLTKVDPSHHLANKNSYAYTHRLEAEKKLGRPLDRGERVKFKDGNKKNCSHGNLIIAAKQSTEERRKKHIAAAVLRKRGVEAITDEIREFLLDIFDGQCSYCNKPATCIDHVMPVRKGGRTEIGNLLPSCAKCNGSKHARGVFEWMIATKRTPNFVAFESIAAWGYVDYEGWDL